MNSIFNIGGDRREKLLLNYIGKADDQLKVHIVAMLGAIQSRAAVPPLIGLLQSRNFSTVQIRDELHSKICHALGTIGDPEAIPALEALAVSKRFLRIKKTNPKVMPAAREAIRKIRQRRPPAYLEAS